MKNYIYFLALILFLFSSCEKFDKFQQNREVESTRYNANYADNINIIALKKLENPYSVENMQKAYDLIQQKGLLYENSMNISATHLYVRFLPRDSSELEMLLNDTTLTLFSYPLDYELTEGEEYTDNTLKGNDFTWLYTRVPVDFTSPIKGYEIIEELYIPIVSDEDEEEQLSSGKITNDFINNWELLENKSLELTGNGETETNTQNTNVSQHTYTVARRVPEAIIRVHDEKRNIYAPVQGVKVRGAWWFYWKTAITDNNGWASLPSKRLKKINWAVVWEGSDWNLRSGFYGQAYYHGPHGSKENWELNINRGGKSFIYGHVHKACFDYWNNNLGLKVPFKSSFWRQKVKIGVSNKIGRAYASPYDRYIFGSIIKIYKFERYTNGNVFEPDCSQYYETTMHELAHISHWNLNERWFRTGEDIVVESWAVGVAYALTSVVYPNIDNWQDVTLDSMKNTYEKKYTPLVIDLIDEYNQRAMHNNSTDYPIDRVIGYSIKDIENALSGARTLERWRDNLKGYNNSTKRYLDELFDNYINIR